MVRLELFLEAQKKFQDTFGFHPPLKDVVAAMMHECGELWEASGGKWWSKKKDTREHRLEETVDLLHFFLIYCTESSFTAKEIFDAYAKKLRTNYKRQEENY